ncbi:hypothetical protein SAMN05444392_101667 [Seinonella peptonophila]|uniref:TFIIB zinc-binding n=1 Tax=Seinonella peptonophila TaxID=112248 RepID=A0A1M4TVL4_9BACL|nr:hypothetical protein [Seinonella peptonophila]SHE48505.1 hypothetical protein SAMN05444392_101667 [Seinonella peptonophila]
MKRKLKKFIRPFTTEYCPKCNSSDVRKDIGGGRVCRACGHTWMTY